MGRYHQIPLPIVRTYGLGQVECMRLSKPPIRYIMLRIVCIIKGVEPQPLVPEVHPAI